MICAMQEFRGVWRIQESGLNGNDTSRLSYALFVRPQVRNWILMPPVNVLFCGISRNRMKAGTSKQANVEKAWTGLPRKGCPALGVINQHLWNNLTPGPERPCFSLLGCRCATRTAICHPCLMRSFPICLYPPACNGHD
jgi:hypothetical protein